MRIPCVCVCVDLQIIAWKKTKQLNYSYTEQVQLIKSPERMPLNHTDTLASARVCVCVLYIHVRVCTTCSWGARS